MRRCLAIATLVAIIITVQSYAAELGEVPDISDLGLTSEGWKLTSGKASAPQSLICNAMYNAIYRLTATRDPVKIQIELFYLMNPKTESAFEAGKPWITVWREKQVGHIETWMMTWTNFCPSYVHYSLDYLGHHDTAYLYGTEAERRFGAVFEEIFGRFAEQIGTDLKLGGAL